MVADVFLKKLLEPSPFLLFKALFLDICPFFGLCYPLLPTRLFLPILTLPFFLTAALPSQAFAFALSFSGLLSTAKTLHDESQGAAVQQGNLMSVYRTIYDIDLPTIQA